METNKYIYALGFFDGVHLGHQALLKACRALAEEKGCFSGVITFSGHPQTLISGSQPALLNTDEDRKRLLRTYGADKVVFLPFDESLMKTHWSVFLTQLLEAGAAGFVCGSDFRFGAGGSGTAKKLSAFCESRNLPYSIVPQQMIGGVRISSTHIRTLVESGEMEQAAEFLGHPHILTGKVIPGRGLGHTMGIPTANLEVPAGLALPKNGVYAGSVHTEKGDYLAVTNVGSRPTVEGHHITVEPWILDFDGDLYGKEITLAFCRFLRPEKKFDSLEELKTEIEKNAAETRKIFGK